MFTYPITFFHKKAAPAAVAQQAVVMAGLCARYVNQTSTNRQAVIPTAYVNETK